MKFDQYTITTEKARNNLETLKLNDRYIHSKVAPEKEAARILFDDKALILIFGYGLGYGLKNLVLNHKKNARYIVYEPFHQLMPKTLPEELEPYKNYILFTNYTNDHRIYKFIHNNFLVADFRIKHYLNQTYNYFFNEAASEFIQNCKSAFELSLQTLMTEEHFIPLWFKNTIKNIKKLTRHPILKFTNVAKSNDIAVIVAAGPNLNNEIITLKKYREYITIFAVDTAIKPLYKSNITPDYVITLDGQYYSLYDFIKNKEFTLISDITAYPRLEEFADKLIISCSSNIYDKSFFKQFLTDIKYKDRYFTNDLVESGGTVSDYALNIAASLGFKNIYLAGYDLGFPHWVTHANESPFHERVLYSQDYYNSPENLMFKVISKRNVTKMQAKNNLTIYSDFILKNYAKYLEYYINLHTDILITNDKNSSLKIDNIKLDKLENLDLIKSVRHNEIFQFKSEDFFKHHNIQQIFNKYIDELYKFSIKIKEMLDTFDFNQNNQEHIDEFETILNNLFNENPFIKKFSIMTIIILNKKGITKRHLLYYKHVGFKTLQSLYFIIRTLQKENKILKKDAK